MDWALDSRFPIPEDGKIGLAGSLEKWKLKSKPSHGISRGYAISNVSTVICPPDL